MSQLEKYFFCCDIRYAENEHYMRNILRYFAIFVKTPIYRLWIL
nr:MAG TPA: hypothetical protein [Caudoviricetes sp.]